MPTKLKIACGILAILIIGLVWSLIFPPNHEVADTYSGTPGETPALTDGMILRQKFSTTQDYNTFGIFFHNYLNFFQEGKLFIKVLDANKNATNFEYNARELKNEAYIYLPCPIYANESYELEIWVENIPKDKNFTFSTIETKTDEPHFSVDNQVQDSTLLLTFVYEQKNYFTAWYFVLGITLVMTYLVLQVDKEFYEKH